jgi:hypothetical protein
LNALNLGGRSGFAGFEVDDGQLVVTDQSDDRLRGSGGREAEAARHDRRGDQGLAIEHWVSP